MKLNLGLELCLAGLCLGALGFLTGCGSNATPDPAVTAKSQEIEKLHLENQDLAQVRTENEEVRRLKKENQELPKLRSQYQETARLKKENDGLKQQIIKISPAAGAALTNSAGTSSAAAGAGALHLGQHDPDKPNEGAEEGIAVNEGDEILIEPKFLKQLLPDFDWDKLERKEPLAVRAMLEKDGLQLTNTAQLRELGLTNFVIQKAIGAPKPVTPGANPNQ